MSNCDVTVGLEQSHDCERNRSETFVGAGDSVDLVSGVQALGEFQIVREIGRGGMGVVYEAIQTSLGRPVALKILPQASSLDSVRLQRFRNEATAVAQLHHPNIVPVFAVGSDRGIHYFAMQFIDGQTLASLIAQLRTEAKLSAASTQSRYRSVVAGMVQAVRAIEYAHQLGILHRDLKPANLMLQADGRVWVTDFGLVQFQDAESQLTGSHQMMGTLCYMSPEQAAGDRAVLDHRTDIYSLGVTLYEWLTLVPAIEADGFHQTVHRVIHSEPPPPRSLVPSLPVDLDTVVRKAICKIPTERYASAREFADDLQRWLDDKPILAEPPSLMQRFAKWRRRHRTFVNAVILLLFTGSLLMAAMTAFVLHEHAQTITALASEREQHEIADENYREARRAIDTFSRLSELELSHHPELLDSRREFLETSQAFYERLLQRRSHDAMETKKLEQIVQRINRLLREIRELESIEPLMWLADSDVRQELGIDSHLDNEVKTLVQELQSARQLFAEQVATMDDAAIELQERNLEQLAAKIKDRLNARQIRSLEEHSRR